MKKNKLTYRSKIFISVGLIACLGAGIGAAGYFGFVYQNNVDKLKAESARVSFNSNGEGKISLELQQGYSNDDILSVATFNGNSKEWVGWFDEPSGGTQFTKLGKGAKTLYAQYKSSFNWNIILVLDEPVESSFQDNLSPLILNEGQSIPSSHSPYWNDGTKVFLGWRVSQNDKSVFFNYLDGSLIPPLISEKVEIRLYPTWADKINSKKGVI